MVDLVLLKHRNDVRWEKAKVTGRLNATSPAKTALANKGRYMLIVRFLRTLGSNMPDDAWVFIAAAHYRESSFDFNTHLGQGDPLTRNGVPVKTVHVPAGRGPFKGPTAFEDAAVDALWFCAPYAARANTDWTISGMLTYLERYNGLKYAGLNRPSPYVWSGTDIYDPPTGPGGKVTVDHGPIMPVVDEQLGVAALLLEIDRLDNSIDFKKASVPSTEPDLDDLELLYDDAVHDGLWLQKSLNKLGATPVLKEDGVIGSATRTATRAFQQAHGLVVDGQAGDEETIPAIIHELSKIEKGNSA